METLIIKPTTQDKLDALKAILKALKIDFEKSSAYDPEMVAKVARGDAAHARGDYKAIKVEDLWK